MSRKRSTEPNTGRHSKQGVSDVPHSETSNTGSYRSGTPDWIRSGSESISQSSAGLSRTFDSDSDTNQSNSTSASTSPTLVDFSQSDIRFPSSRGSSDSKGGQTTSGSSSSSSSGSSSSSSSSSGSSGSTVSQKQLTQTEVKSRKRSVDQTPSEHSSHRLAGVSQLDTPESIKAGSEGSHHSRTGLNRIIESDSETNQSSLSSASTSRFGRETDTETVKSDSSLSISSLDPIDCIDNNDIQFIQNQSPKYEFKELIEKGSFGFVYSGTRLPENTICAIKVVLRGTQMRLGVKHEANICIRIMSSLHRYVLEFYNVFINAQLERAYICSEYSSIGDLYKYMKQLNSSGVSIWQTLEEPKAKYIINCIAQGVNHLHSMVDIAHGDIKPENILLFLKPNKAQTETTDIFDLIPKISDFSNSRHLETEDKELWVSVRLCTLNYAAPETEGVYDMFRADVYSVGCLLLAILLGARPFDPPIAYPSGNGPEDEQQRNDYKTMCSNRKNSKEYLAEICNNFSPILKELLIAVLDPNPETRLSLNQFLEHQWFDTHSSGLSHTTDDIS